MEAAPRDISEGGKGSEGLRILHLNSWQRGGSGLAARRIHSLLLESGADSLYCFVRGEPEGPAQIRLKRARSNLIAACRVAGAVVRNVRHGLPPGWRSRPGEISCAEIRARLPVFPADAFAGRIPHLHWTEGLLDIPSFFRRLRPGSPVVCTLHDLAHATGGCHYPGACERYAENCGDCPVLGIPGERLSSHNLRLRASVAERFQLHVVANSHWTETRARRSRAFRNAASIRTIHYGLDTRQFTPALREEARREFGVPGDLRLLGFSADILDDPRKGWPTLQAALRSLPGDLKFGTLLLGGSTDAPPPAGGCWHRTVGYTAERATVARFHAALDLFIMPSREEAFGQVAIEAMASGVPVIVTDQSGACDVVEPGVTGYVVPADGVAELAAGIRLLLSDPAGARRMGAAGRAVAVDRFTQERERDAYLRLYRTLA